MFTALLQFVFMIISTQYDVERKYCECNYMAHNYTTCIKGS